MLARLERRGNATVIHHTAPRQVHGRATKRRHSTLACRPPPCIAAHHSTSCPATELRRLGAQPHQFPIFCVGNSITAPSAAITSAFRGWPLARWVTRPSGPSTNVVGVRSTPNRLTRSSLESASISICVTPSTILATSDSTCLVARHGAQKAEENWTRVARPPSAALRSAVLSSVADCAPVGRSGEPATALRSGAGASLPLRARHHAPIAVATTSAPTAATSPELTAGEQYASLGHSLSPGPPAR